MSLAGSLTVSTRFVPDGPAQVRITPPRAVPVSALLAGCRPSEVVSRVRMLFSLCGNAHAVAACAALEAALGMAANEATRQARGLLVMAEALREHVFRIIIDWPALLDEPPDPGALRTLTGQFARLQTLIGEAIFEPGHAGATMSDDAVETARTLAVAGRTAVFGKATWSDRREDIAACPDGDDHVAARLVRRCDRLASSAFDMPAEDRTLLGRNGHIAALAANEAQARVMARLAEVEKLADLLSRASSTPASCLEGTAMAGENRQAGQATIDVARGRLHHALGLADGRILDYAIEAPTGRNFEPGGAAERAISRIRATDRAAFEWEVRLHVLEIDPCVAHEVRFH